MVGALDTIAARSPCAQISEPVRSEEELLRNQALLTPPELEARLHEFYDALDQFNDGWYFESHETLEDLWMVTPMPEREMFQGIIQMAAAFVHMVRGEQPGVVKLLDAAIDKLSRAESGAFGVDTALLLEDLRGARAEVAHLPPDDLRRWGTSGVPNVRFVRKERLLGGDVRTL
jgi:predicted metal-dependent hydrolase